MWKMVGRVYEIEELHGNSYIIKGYIWNERDFKKISDNLADKSPKMFDVNNLLSQEN